jgi:formylglycine-generating enzyme required for sulfatase activity
VALAAPFLIARTEVPQSVWESVMEANASRFKGESRPVETVSWTEAVEFCRRTGLALPSEAQWEYACRAGTSLRYSGFDSEDELGDHAWYERNAERRGTGAVGSKKPNAFGLYDVHGNVWEWCRTPYRAELSAQVEDAPGPRVYRGGSWYNSARSARCAQRFKGAEDLRDAALGFRPIRDIPVE